MVVVIRVEVQGAINGVLEMDWYASKELAYHVAKALRGMEASPAAQELDRMTAELHAASLNAVTSHDTALVSWDNVDRLRAVIAGIAVADPLATIKATVRIL